jgi:hypothetical protein
MPTPLRSDTATTVPTEQLHISGHFRATANLLLLLTMSRTDHQMTITGVSASSSPLHKPSFPSSRIKRKLISTRTFSPGRPFHPSSSHHSDQDSLRSIIRSRAIQNQAFIKAFPELLLQSCQQDRYDYRRPMEVLSQESQPKKSNPFSSERTGSKYQQTDKMVSWTTSRKPESNLPW